MSPQTPDFSNVRSGTSSVPASAPDFSNVQSGTSAVSGSGGTGGAADVRHYTVQKGDTLSHIARHFYGKASAWHAIFDANRDQLEDPDRIRPGQVLVIPSHND
ncbi:LysM peptidoglycan-binding domain-containing protein [Lysobacter xanthus]